MKAIKVKALLIIGLFFTGAYPMDCAKSSMAKVNTEAVDQKALGDYFETQRILLCCLHKAQTKQKITFVQKMVQVPAPAGTCIWSVARGSKCEELMNYIISHDLIDEPMIIASLIASMKRNDKAALALLVKVLNNNFRKTPQLILTASQAEPTLSIDYAMSLLTEKQKDEYASLKEAWAKKTQGSASNGSAQGIQKEEAQKKQAFSLTKDNVLELELMLRAYSNAKKLALALEQTVQSRKPCAPYLITSDYMVKNLCKLSLFFKGLEIPAHSLNLVTAYLDEHKKAFGQSGKNSSALFKQEIQSLIVGWRALEARMDEVDPEQTSGPENLLSELTAIGEDPARKLLDDFNDAICAHHTERVKVLLQNPTLNIDDCDIMGVPPLAYAISFGFSDIVKLLIDNNADVNFTKDQKGFSPLIFVNKGLMTDNDARAIHAMLKKSNINTQDAEGKTPLIRASILGDALLIACLINNGAQKDIFDQEGRTALMHAASLGKVDAVKVLLQSGANYKIHNEQFETAYNLAYNHPNVQALLQQCNGAEAFEKEIKQRLHIATKKALENLRALHKVDSISLGESKKSIPMRATINPQSSSTATACQKLPQKQEQPKNNAERKIHADQLALAKKVESQKQEELKNKELAAQEKAKQEKEAHKKHLREKRLERKLAKKQQQKIDEQLKIEAQRKTAALKLMPLIKKRANKLLENAMGRFKDQVTASRAKQQEQEEYNELEQVLKWEKIFAREELERKKRDDQERKRQEQLSRRRSGQNHLDELHKAYEQEARQHLEAQRLEQARLKYIAARQASPHRNGESAAKSPLNKEAAVFTPENK